MKSAGVQSLRGQVDKWLAPDAASLIRVTGFGRLRSGKARYVSVEVLSTQGPRSLYFFRHADGNWCVYPPGVDRAAAAAPASAQSRPRV
jgi:hypothetical protein